MLSRVLPVLLVLLPLSARAERLDLLPPTTEVGIRFYGLGFVPLDGTFTRFRGWLEHDPNRQRNCVVRLTVDASSLTMANTAIRDEIVGPDYLDIANYPRLAYDGRCDGDDMTGQLEMHGVQRPFALTIERSPERYIATGRLRRADWGMAANPTIGGQTVRIRVTIQRMPSSTSPAVR